MATAIDFEELLREERLRRKEADGRSRSSKCCPSRNEASAATSSVAPHPVTCSRSRTSISRYVRERKKIDLDAFHVRGSLRDSVFYVNNFMAESEEKKILNDVDLLPWIQLRRRKLQNHGGSPHPDGMFRERLPSFLQHICAALVEAGIFPSETPPNHVLVNSYARGQGIAPHRDGPLYAPCVAILTFDGPARLDFFSSLRNAKDGDPITSVLCESRSLLVFRHRAYRDLWHGIKEGVSEDRIEAHTGNAHTLRTRIEDGHRAIPRAARRVSLTIRHVPNVRDDTKRFVTAEALAERSRKDKWWVESRGEG